MNNNFDIFKKVSNEDLHEVYKEIIGSKELGLRPKALDPYIRIIKDSCNFSMTSEAWKFTEELFFKEVASRFFRGMSGDES